MIDLRTVWNEDGDGGGKRARGQREDRDGTEEGEVRDLDGGGHGRQNKGTVDEKMPDSIAG